MLHELLIKNFTIIDNIKISFHKGLNVITGETGAGKSIILDALDFVLGGRFDGKIIRSNCTECEVTAIFSVPKDKALQQLAEDTGFNIEDDECYLKRILNKDGRSRAFINDSPVTLQKLKQLGLYLIQIYGQHEHQTLLKADTQLNLIDHYGKHELKTIEHLFQQQQQLSEELAQLKLKAEASSETNKLLQYQLAELETLNLSANELSQLYHEQKQLSHAQELLSQSAEINNTLRDDEPSVLGSIANIQKQLDHLKQFTPSLNNASNLLSEAYTLIEEASIEVKDFHEGLELDPERLSDVEKRIDALHHIARKHQIQPEQLFEHYKTLSATQSKTLNLDADIKATEEKLQSINTQYLKATETLSKQREKTAHTLETKVTQYIHKLGMPKGKFCIQLTPLEHMSKTGMDRVDFQAQLNPGQAADSMKNVASGGELSRIGLALALLTGETSIVPTMIFDEVDVGVSGAVAEMIGQLLRDLGQRLQVISITHLAQVAVYAHQHILVKKHQSKTSTTTSAIILDLEGRANALASILSGAQISQDALKHAQEWLKKVIAE